MDFRMNSVLFGLFLTTVCTSSHGMNVWLVESGADPFSNTGSILTLAPGATILDLYYDLEGDVSYGYDFDLSVFGEGSIMNVRGGDASGLGADTDDGWRQFGGDIYGESGASVLAFTFDLYSEAGTQLLFSGSYTDSSFSDAKLDGITLAQTVAPVPVPAPFFLLLSAILSWFGVRCFKRQPKN